MKDLWIKDGVPFRNPLIVDDRAIYNPTPEELTAAGYSIYVPPAPEPEPEPEPIDRTAFDSACQQFRAVCAQIGVAIGNENFRGGFDEMDATRSPAGYGVECR